MPAGLDVNSFLRLVVLIWPIGSTKTVKGQVSMSLRGEHDGGLAIAGSLVLLLRVTAEADGLHQLRQHIGAGRKHGLYVFHRVGAWDAVYQQALRGGVLQPIHQARDDGHGAHQLHKLLHPEHPSRRLLLLVRVDEVVHTLHRYPGVLHRIVRAVHGQVHIAHELSDVPDAGRLPRLVLHLEQVGCINEQAIIGYNIVNSLIT